LSGGATITGTATLSGGTLDLVGNRLTGSQFLVTPGGVFSNSVTGATLSGGVTNAGTVWFSSDVYVNGPVTNTGTWYQKGVVSNDVINSGTFSLFKNSVNPLVTGGIINSGSLVFDNNNSPQVNGSITNTGSVAFNAVVNGNYVQTAGSLVINQSAGNPTVKGTASISGGTFDLNGKTYTNGLMVVSGGGVLTNSQTGATFNGGLSNAATVFLPNATTFNGPVTNMAAFSWQGTINNTYAQGAGTNQLLGAATITQGANVSGGLFDLNGKTYSNNLMVVSGTGVLTSSLANATFNGGLSNAATVFLPNATTFNGPVTNMAAFSWQGTINNTYAQGAGTNQLLGAGTITGNVSVNAGLIDLNGNTESFGALAGTGGTILNNGAANSTLTMGANNGGGTYSGTITNGIGALALVKTGTGTETLTGNNGYSGGTTVNNGTLVDNSSTALGSGGLAMTGGALQMLANLSLADLSGTAGTIGIFSNGLSETLTVGSDNSSTTFSGLISPGGNASTHLALIKNGSGVLTLGGLNSYNGGSTINGGVLSANTLPNAGSTSSSIGTGSLTLNGGTLRYTGVALGTANFSTALGANGGTLDAVSSIFYSGTLSGSGTLNILDSSGGGNAWLFTTGSPGFTGNINIGSGSPGSGFLQVRGVTSANQVGTGTVTVNGGGTFSYDQGSAATIANPIVLNGGALGAQSVAVTYSGPIAISNNSFIGGVQAAVGTTMTLSGAITGPGGFATAGNNATTTIVLGNANTFSGGVTINSGTVELNNTLAVQNSTVSNLVANGLIFGTPTAYTLGGLAGTGNIGLGSVALSVGNNNSNTTYSGVLSGTGSLTKIGAGVLTLSGANSYSGATTISGGTLKLGANNVIPDGASAGNITDNSTLDMGGFSDTINGLSGSGTVDNSGVGASTLTVGNNNATSAFGGTIQNTGGSLAVTKIGTGVLTLSGNNTFSGVLTVQAGTLSVATVNNSGAAGPLGQSANAVVLGGASTIGTLEYTGATASSTKPFAIGAAGDNSTLGGVIQIDNSGATLSLSGQVNQVNQGLLTKSGSGTLVLAGTQDNVGLGVIVKAGTLVLGKTSTSGVHAIGGAGFTLAGGTVQLGGTGGDQIYDNSVDITVNSGTFDFNGNSETIGGLTGTGGTILNNGGGASTMTVGFNNDSPTYSGTITDHSTGTGTMAVAKVGTGTEILSGSNSYSGGTTISAGTLKLGNANALGTGGLNMNGGTLNLNLYSISVANLSGNSGTILANSGAFGGTYTLTVGSDNTSTTYGGIIANNTDGFSETVALTKIGAGVLSLSGNNTYSGNTVIQSGGAINIQNANALGSTTAGTTVNSGGALQIQGGITTAAEPLTLNGTGVANDGALRNISGNNTYAGAITMGSATRINSDSGTLTLSSFSSGGNFALTIGGAGNTLISAALPATVNSLTKDGTGVLTLSGANAYSGATTISAGTLKLGASNVIPDGASAGNVTDNGTLDLAGFSDTINGLSGSGTVDNSGGGTPMLTVGNNNATSVFAGTIQNTSGTLALTKTGTGTLTLSGSLANTYSGVTTVNAGELDLNKTAGVNAIGGSLTIAGGEVKLLASEQLANGAVVTINSGSFNLNGATETVGSMIVGAAGLLTNGVAGGGLNGGITNNGTIFASQATYLNGPVTNTGSIFFLGAISNNLVNRGSFNLNDDSTLTAAPVNTGTMDAKGNTLTVTPDWANSGTILLGGGSLAGGNLTNNSGAVVMQTGAISNAVINSGNVIATNGELRLVGVASGTGAYKAAAGASPATLTFAGGGSISALFNTNATIQVASVLTNNSVFVNQGTIVVASGTYQSTANLTNAAGEFIINSGAGTINAAGVFNLGTILATNATVTISNLFAQGGTVAIGAGGTLYLPGAVGVTNFGTINLQGAVGNNAVLNLDGGMLTNKSGGTITGGGIIQSAAQVVNLLGGSILATSTVVELQFTNSNTFGNAGTIGAGTGATLTFGAAGVGSALITNFGTINLTGGTLNSGAITNLASGFLGGTGTITAPVVNQGGRVNLGGTIANSFLQTAGSFTVSGGATVTGAATINGGTLDLVGGQLTDGMLLIASGATLTNSVQNASLNGGITNAGTVNLFRDTYINGAVTNTGTWIQRGAISNSVVNSGVMALYTNSINVRVTGSIVNSGSLTFDTNGVVYVSGVVSNSGSFAFSDVISNNLVNTAGSITLIGNGTVTGNTMVNGGTFDLNGKSLTNSFMVVSGTGVLANGAAGAILNGGLSNAATVSFTQNVTLNGPVTNMATFAWQGTINNSYTQGAGTNLLNGNATITGNTTISDGLVDLNGKNATFGSLNGGGGTLLNNGNGASVMTVNGGGSYSGTIADHTVGTGTMGVTVGGSTLTLSGNNTYSGVTTINSGGTLKLGSATALGSVTGNTLVNSGGVLDLNGQAIGSEPVTLNGTGISSGGALINSSGTGASLGGAITLGSASSIGGSGDMTLGGAIGGGNNLTKVGADTVTLTAANGYTGATMINSGVLNIQNNTALGTVAGGVTVASGAALQLQGGITVGAEALSLNGTGISNDGALRNISGSNSYGGAITLAGASRINSDAGTLTLGGGIAGGGYALTIGGAGNVLVSSAIGGTSTTLTKDGAGILNLTGNNNHTGATVVNGGTLKVNNASGSGISGGGVTVNNGGTLGGTGTITVGVTVNSGGQLAPGNSVGTFNVGTLTLASGSVLDFEFNSTPANDLINVLNSGGLTINGGGFDLYQEGTTTAWSTAGTYNLISYSGTLGGSIGNLSVLNPAADKVYTFGSTGSMITLQIAGGQSWTGLGSDNFWSSGANWSTATPSAGDLLVFDGTTRINNTNNLAANTQFAGITYDVSAGAFTNSGNAVNLTGGIVNNSTNTQTIKLPLVFDGGNRTINAASGALVISGPISDTNGTWGLIKSGAGTLTLGGTTANTYSGLTTVNAGELDLNKTAGQNAVGGDLSVNNGATVRLLASEQIGNTANVTVNNGGQFNLNGFAETVGGMVNAGSLAVGGGALTVSQTLQNSGTVTLTAGGAVAGGVLSNLSSGSVSGSGFIKSFMVNQGAMNFGGTISNNLLQTAGSFVLNGNATITGNAMLNGGSIELAGDALTYNSLTIGSSAVLQNGGSGAAIMNGNVTNSGLVNFFVSNETTVNGNVVNSGEWDQTGVINGNLVNSGSFTWLTWLYSGSTPHLTGGLINSGSMDLNSTYAEQIDGSVTNTGTITLHGAIGGSYLQTAGRFYLDTAGTINGAATVTGGSFDLAGNTYTGSRMIVAGTGVLTNSIAGATFNSGLSNAANVGVTANTFFTGPVTNTGTFAFMGAVSNTLVNSGDVILNGSGTISGILANSGSVNVNNGTLSLVVAPTQTGTITINAGATLNAAQAWVNSGTIVMLGGVVTNAAITNANFISGYGTIDGGGVVNNGKIFANASSISGIGTQTVRLTSFTNNNAATIGTASSNAVLNILEAGNVLINQGTISLSGGTILFNGGVGTITNFNIIAGVGNVANFPIINGGTLASFVAQAPISGLSNLIATIGVTNNGLLGANNLINGAATLSLSVSGGGAAIVNQGTVALQGGFLTINGGAGVITNVNNGLIYGVGTQKLSVANLASGKIMASNGIFSLGLQSDANAGVLSNLNAGSTILLTNKFLVNTGTIVLNGGGLLLGGGVITNESSITGPGALSSSLYNDAAGVVLATNGLLNVATNAGESVQNLGLFTISSDGTLNVVSSWVNTNGTVNVLGGGLTGGAVTNVGLVSGFGTISSQLVNMGGGTLTASGAGSLTLVAAPTQNGWVNIASAGTLNVQQAWLNSGVVNVQGGSLVGSTVTNSGTIFGSGTITPLVRNNSGGTVTANGGTLTLTVAPSQLGSVVISNAATLNVLQAWQNGGLLSMSGGTAIGSTITNAANVSGFGTIAAQLVNNVGATVTANGGTLKLTVAPAQLGNLVISNAATLNALQAWQNSGSMRMRGGTVIGSSVTNAASIEGFGTINPQVVNNAGATLTADSGLLTLALALMQNGTVIVTNGGTLNVLTAWQNSGTVAMLGGNITGSTVTNAGTMTGFGGVQSAVNNDLIFVTNGTLQATASFTQNGRVNIAGNARLDVTPTWLNNGTILLNGGFTSGGTMTNASLLVGFGTISNAVVNDGSLVATNGALSLVNALTQSGTITVANAATFNSVLNWQNGGFLSMLGGSVVGGQLTNAGSVTGFGTFSPSVINNSGATITASGGGTLTLTAIPLQNGIVNILGTLNVASAWSNGSAGTVTINGGMLTGGTFTVDGTVGGNGTIAANMIVGSGKTVTVSGGTLNLTALTTMNGGAINSGTLVNYGTISGDGTIGSTLSNPGYVRATNGLLYIQALSGNQATGTLEASAGGTLQANGVTPWLNNGQVILSGGTIIGGDISNSTSRIISGYGTITPNVYNGGTVLANNASQALTLDSSLVNLSGGLVTANAGNLDVGGAFVNQGTLAMANSMGTFAGTVVNSGAWITNPTTNVFQNTYTVTSSGFIQSSPGDLYIFSNNATTAASFVNLSTNKTQYNTLNSTFLFANTLGLTQEFATAGHDFGPATATATNQIELSNTNPFSLPQYSNNFALGTLEISSYTTVRVDSAFLDGGSDTDLTAALYLNNLDMGTDSLLIISTNVEVYFINSNNWSLANVQLEGNPNYDQIFDGIHQFVVVPEPSIVLLWLSSIATIYAASKRGAGRK
jgi:fibronectin-binding autotransporter adhesin